MCDPWTSFFLSFFSSLSDADPAAAQHFLLEHARHPRYEIVSGAVFLLWQRGEPGNLKIFSFFSFPWQVDRQGGLCQGVPGAGGQGLDGHHQGEGQERGRREGADQPGRLRRFFFVFLSFLSFFYRVGRDLLMCLQSLAVDVFDVPEMLVCFFFGPLFGGGSACEREKNLVQKKKKLVLFLSYFFILKREKGGKAQNSSWRTKSSHIHLHRFTYGFSLTKTEKKRGERNF